MQRRANSADRGRGSDEDDTPHRGAGDRKISLSQMTEIDGAKTPLFAGVWAIFGHGNVAGLGEALYAVRDRLPTYRAHNEQAMALSAIAYAKAMRRRRIMACTSSIGPGATNMVTAAAVAHVNRLPLLLLPGDVFAKRAPDPVLQQIENFGDGTASVNDCFRPVSRYFDRIVRPEQIIPALSRAIAVLTDPADCGPVTLAFCQDVQTEAFDYPETLLRRTLASLASPAARRARAARMRRRSSPREEAARHLRRRRPLFVGGGRAHRLLRKARHSRRRDPSRQIGDAERPSAAHGRHRRHRLRGVQSPRRGSRRRARRRHAARRLHHRLLGPVQEPGSALHRAQCPAVRRGQTPVRSRSSATPSSA